MDIVFPKPFGKYYNKHVKYVFNVFKQAKCSIQLSIPEYVSDCAFVVVVQGKRCLFDLSDFPDIPYSTDMPILKRTLLEPLDNVYPMGPFMVLNHETGKDYRHLLQLRQENHRYSVDDIYYNQRVFGAAIKTRSAIYKELRSKRETLSQRSYWNKALDYKFNRFIPGANDVVLDRAPSEIMFLGGSIIHPEIRCLFPYYKRLRPGKHYNLPGDKYKYTGGAAKEFYRLAEPHNLVNWWREVLC